MLSLLLYSLDLDSLGLSTEGNKCLQLITPTDMYSAVVGGLLLCSGKRNGGRAMQYQDIERGCFGMRPIRIQKLWTPPCNHSDSAIYINE